MRQSKDVTFDALLQLKDAGLVAASAAATVGGQARIVDLGKAYLEGRVIIDVSAIEVASGDEGYRIRMQISDSSTFASGVFTAAVLPLGDSTTTGASADSTTGRYTLGFSNEMGGVQYRYARLYTEVVGTVATGINYTAFIAK